MTKTEDMAVPEMVSVTKRCAVDGCNNTTRTASASVCQMHYSRHRRHGSYARKHEGKVAYRRVVKTPAMLNTRPLGEPSKVDASRFWSHVNKLSAEECWPWEGSYKGAYGTIHTFAGARSVGAHRASYRLVNGPIPDGFLVRHKCDNPGCVNPDHLEVGTGKDNVADMLSRGRANPLRGEAHQNTKLTDADVAEVRRLLSAGVMRKDVAEMFGVSTYAIYYAIRWRKAA